MRIGTREEFAAVREFLRAVGFDERTVAATLKISDISQIPKAVAESMDNRSASVVLLAVIELFVLGRAISADPLRAACGEPTFAAFLALDLIRPSHHCPHVVRCPVWIYPIDGFFIVSDRQINVESDAVGVATEVVFPAHDSGTLQLLRLMPTANGVDALDLCGGSGVGALHLARAGARAASVDITSRSAHFAAFNAQLNGIEIESLCGDLYAPVAGRRFDIIGAHPPWLPSIGDAMVFRDGGDTGETTIQRIFVDLPHHLKPGGTSTVVALGRDCSDAPYEHRVRRWLGDVGRDCDVILGVDTIMSIDEVVASVRRLHLNEDAEKAERLADRLRTLGTEKFVYGAVFVRRTSGEVTEPPLRLRMSRVATAADFEHIFAWRWYRRQPHFAEWLAAARPRLSPELEANIRYVVRDGAMVVHSAILTAQRPLAATVRPDVWIARLIEQLKGTRTVEETFKTARQAGQVPNDFSLPAFVDLLGRLIERGLVEVDKVPTE